MAAIDELRQLGDAWQNRPQLIEQARQEGTTWVVIADALHMTRRGVVKLHATLKENEASYTVEAVPFDQEATFTPDGTGGGHIQIPGGDPDFGRVQKENQS